MAIHPSESKYGMVESRERYRQKAKYEVHVKRQHDKNTLRQRPITVTGRNGFPICENSPRET